MWSAKLDYEPQTSARPVVVEHEENVTRVIVPMHGPYAPVPQWVGQLEFFALIIWPIWWIGSLLEHVYSMCSV